MLPDSRRNFLRYGIAMISGSLAGCTAPSDRDGPSGRDSEAQPTARDSETESPGRTSETESTVQASIEDLNPTASVVTQASNESPAKIKLSLENTLAVPVSVYPGSLGMYALEFLSHLNGEMGEIMLYPGDTGRVIIINGESPERPVDGCWRVPPDEEDARGPYLAGNNYPKEVEIAPAETYSVLHDAYYLGPDSHCFPADTYKTTNEIEIGEEERTPVELTYSVEVGSEGQFEAAVEYGE